MVSPNISSFLGNLTQRMAGEVLANLSDQQLVEKALLECNEMVFQAILSRHGPLVYRVCWRVLQHTHDVEDAFQATFLILARKLRSVRKQASLASWLHGVAFRVALKAKAQTSTRQLHEKQKAIPAIIPSEDISWKEISSILDFELQKLPEKWRLPLILCYLEGRTQDEASRELGWSKNTLRARLEEARNSLGRRLTSRGVTWPIASSAILISDSISSSGFSADLFRSTVQLSTNTVLGQSTNMVVSANTALLTKGIIQTMFLKKLQIAVAVFLGLGFLTTSLLTSDLLGQPQIAQVPQRDKNFFPQSKKGGKSENPKELSDFGKLQGSWKPIQVEVESKFLDKEEVKKLGSIIIEGDRFDTPTGPRGGQPRRGRFSLDLVGELKQITFKGEGEDSDLTWYGIYELDGNILKLCINTDGTSEEKPKEMKTQKGSSFIVMTLLREPTSDQAMKLPLGDWVLVSAEHDEGLGELEKGTRYQFEEGKLTIRKKDDKEKASFDYEIKVDPKKDPKEIDLIEEIGNRRIILRGIYRFEKEKLIICFGIAIGDGIVVKNKRIIETQRPTEFKIGHNLQVLTLEPLSTEQPKVKDKEPKEAAALKDQLTQNQKLIEELERLTKEQIELLGTVNRLTKDLNRAKKNEEDLKKIRESFRGMNKKLRDELGLREGVPIPKK
jgi:RNA polymerase sigma factor (sigma-70 family)